MEARVRRVTATWSELERADPELAAFGRERFQGNVVFHATLTADGSPRLHPVSPWFASGFLVVGFREHSPKVAEVARDGRYAMHSAIGDEDHEGAGGEFLVRGWMERLGPDHPAAIQRPYEAPYEVAAYACSIVEAVGTTYDGDTPLYRRWREPIAG
jgi:hypothetical protein